MASSSEISASDVVKSTEDRIDVEKTRDGKQLGDLCLRIVDGVVSLDISSSLSPMCASKFSGGSRFLTAGMIRHGLSADDDRIVRLLTCSHSNKYGTNCCCGPMAFSCQYTLA